jgi:transposase InsO family protein
MEGISWKGRTAGAEAGSAADAPAVGRIRATGANSSRRYSVAEKLALVEEFARSGERFSAFCARRQVSSASLCKWRRQMRSAGEAGLAPKPNPGNALGRHGPVRTPQARRQAIEAFAQSGLGVAEFARLWGLSPGTLRGWIVRYRAGGPRALEPRRPGCPKGRGAFARRVPEAVRAEIARTKQRFPDFGLKRVRDFLGRFLGLRVSTGTVARVLEEQGIARQIPPHKRRRSRPLPRRFERAMANELWRTDITSFVIGRARVRVYLIVFLDDYSRFIVSHGLHVFQRGEIAKEALLEGIARYGKPREVLSDQGRQYFAWRGKSEFQQLLAKQGIHHAVARAHHPETVGKCERFWESLKSEFLSRVEPEDLPDARERVGHFIAHYNFFRPHQGIGGLVPADRFFGAEQALRRTHEERLAQDELALALSERPRTRAYLFGQIGDEQVSLHGERGQLVVQTSSGLRAEIGLDELGASGAKESSHARDGRTGADGFPDGPLGQVPQAPGKEAPALRGALGDAARSARAVGQCAQRSAAEGTSDLRGDLVSVAGQETARGGGQCAVDPAAAGVAAQPAGVVGYAGGPSQAAQDALPSGGEHGLERGRSAPAEAGRSRSWNSNCRNGRT